VAHCPFELLADLAPVLDVVRTWEGVRERTPGTFYVKSTPWMHFHLKGDRRWADVRHGKEWGPEVDVPLDSTEKQRAAFLKTIAECHRLTLGAKGVSKR
jgi:hypothetical protein